MNEKNINGAWFDNLFGFCRSAPINILHEEKGSDSISISIFKDTCSYFYGYKVKIGSIVKDSPARVGSTKFTCYNDCLNAAYVEIKQLCKIVPNNYKRLKRFDCTNFQQPDLFNGDYMEALVCQCLQEQ